MIIIAVCIFFLSTYLMAMYAIVGLAKSPKYWKKYLPFYILTIFIVSYSFIPLRVIDLNRYFDMVKEISKYTSFADIISYRNDGLVIKNIIFWLIGKTEDVHLLPAFSNSVVYGVTAYITCNTAKEYKAERMIPYILLFQFALLPFYSITSNVRNVCAFSIVVLAAYLDMVKKDRSIRVWILYIIPCFIHSAAFFLVLFRLAVFIVKKHKIVVTAVFAFLPFLISLAYQNISVFAIGGNIGNWIQTGIVKIYRYWNTEDMTSFERAIQASIFDSVRRLYMMSFAALIAVIILTYYFSKHNEKKNEDFNIFVYLICIMTLTCNIFIAPHYWRFFCAVVISCPMILIPFLLKRKYWVQFVKCLLIVFLIGGFANNVWRFKGAVDFSDWGLRILMNNIYVILGKAVIHLIGL